MPNLGDRRLVVVSNRLPVRMTKEQDTWSVSPSPGGLVTALNPVLKQNRGTWIGWVGTEIDDAGEAELAAASSNHPYNLISVPLSQEEENLYYRGYSNETLWPLLHDLLGYCKFERHTWEYYQMINRRFAEVIAANIEPDDVIWVHDYQLMLVGQYLREMGVQNPIIYFLHIPFPTSDLFRRLPEREEIIHGLLSYDLVGFQTRRDHHNFVNAAQELLEDVGARTDATSSTVFYNHRRVRIGDWAISIDFDEFYDMACSKEVAEEAWFFHEHFEDRIIVLGLDRLDYTKGIPERFLAFERFLEKYPEFHGKICFYQGVVPSRTHVPDYQDLKKVIDELVGRINGRFSKAGWVPLHYVYRSLDRKELLARYAACEIALITPLRDGMNLIAKEYCSSCVHDRGVLILSEFAGAAEQLGDAALLVNPFDLEKTADTLYRAARMEKPEREQRMRHLREHVRQYDVHHWVSSIFKTAGLLF